MKKRVGFVGLGVMGRPMAQHVAKACELTVFDVNVSRMEGFERKAAQLSDVARQADVVLLSLPSTAIVRSVVLGEGGLCTVAAKGAIVIDMSTTEPAVTHEMQRALTERGIEFLDAPVSGGEKGAMDGALSIMVGGKQRVFEECVEVLRTMGSTVIRVGDTGAGEVAKLVNNLIVGITFAAVAEGFALAAKSGLEPSVLFEAIRNGWAGSKVLEVAAPAMLQRDFRPGGSVDLHWKDLGYALAQARELDVPVPLTAMTHEIFKAARASGNGKLAQPVIVQLWEKLLGIEVKGSAR